MDSRLRNVTHLSCRQPPRSPVRLPLASLVTAARLSQEAGGTCQHCGPMTRSPLLLLVIYHPRAAGPRRERQHHVS
ncbi:hypothetical protein GN956_G24132 [Arapaima gigas]